jgi:hypothetical protein
LQATNGAHEVLGNIADMKEEEVFEVKLSHAVKMLAAEVCGSTLLQCHVHAPAQGRTQQS